MDPAELIREMNRTGGLEEPAPAAPTPTPSPTPAAPAASEPAKPAEPANPAPKSTTEPINKDPKDKDYKVSDPPFVPQGEKSDLPADEEEPNKPQTTTEEGQTPPPAVDDDAVYSRLSDLTDGSVKSEEDLVSLINSYNELVEQSEKGFEPKFPDERTKWAYQILSQNPETALETVERTIHALKLKDVKEMSPKDALFNAYFIDPKNYDLSLLEARDYFEADFQKKYPDLENDPLQKRALEVAGREAKQSILKVQEDFKTTEAKPQQISKDVIDSVTKVVSNFGGVRIAFTENPQENDYLNIPLEGDEKDLLHNALYPNEWLNSMLERHQTENGFDYQSYIQERFEMINHKEIRQKAYEQGIRVGQRMKANEDRNSTTKKEIEELARTPAPAIAREEPGSLYDAWGKAQAGG